jgi:hypothetical protein
MPWYIVRDYEADTKKAIPWDDIVQIEAEDAQAAAKRHAQKDCNIDPEIYRLYESGRFLEVKESSAETSTLVSVSVSFDPHFSARIEREKMRTS